ncbi:hypothetical protein [Sphingobium mellinum]
MRANLLSVMPTQAAVSGLDGSTRPRILPALVRIETMGTGLTDIDHG